jgi:F-type H+-transporting ATPase subunit a
VSVENAEHGGGGFAIDPMHQFEIKTYFPLQLGSIDASFTNSSLFMVIAAALLTILMLAGMSRRAMVPGRLQSIVELSYEFIANMLRDNVGTAGLRFFPFVFTLFMFILALNLLGMIPYSFTVTSHIIVTFALAFFIFIGVTILGFAVHGFGFFKFFVPHGVPAYLLPLVVPIEVVSYLTRPISLSVRLFANMMAGHTVLKVFAGFVIALGAFGYLPGLLPLAFMVALTGLEVLVAALQAYVFAILTCIYLNDALHMH